MADQTSNLEILGEIMVNAKVLGNNLTFNNLVSRGGDEFIIGTLDTENHGLIVDFKAK